MYKYSVLSPFLIILALITACSNFSSQPLENSTINVQVADFKEPDSSEWVQYMQPLREYFFLRKQSILRNDINILWNKYPKLSEHIDEINGINSEKFEVESLNNSFTLIDANISIEGYDRIKVREVNEDEVIIQVHAQMTFLRDDFEESGGEVLIELHLELLNDYWTVVKTNEYTLPEYKEWLKNN